MQVQNAVDYLKIIGALDENENLTVLGKRTYTFCILVSASPAIFLSTDATVFPSLFLCIRFISRITEDIELSNFQGASCQCFR